MLLIPGAARKGSNIMSQRFTETLRAASDPSWSQAVGHRFVEELFAGAVPDAVDQILEGPAAPREKDAEMDGSFHAWRVDFIPSRTTLYAVYNSIE